MIGSFHLSICVKDLESTRSFYTGVLGCTEVKSGTTWADFAFYGHQLTCHELPDRVRPARDMGLDGNHFGAFLTLDEFEKLEQKLRAISVTFLNEPGIQYPGTSRERRRMVFVDPSGNAIEIKSSSLGEYLDGAEAAARRG